VKRDLAATHDELIHALGRGDEAALAELYDRYGNAVYYLALRITHDPSAAEEISLDAFHHVWQQAARLIPSSTSVQSWLFTVARSRAIDRQRALSAAKRTHSNDPTPVNSVPQPDELTDLAKRRELVRHALADLSPAQRTALELAYYEGLSHSQIAARLNEPLGTVKTHIRQAMNVLRKSLTPVLST